MSWALITSAVLMLGVAQRLYKRGSFDCCGLLIAGGLIDVCIAFVGDRWSL